jgi:hypothetical protein
MTAGGPLHGGFRRAVTRTGAERGRSLEAPPKASGDA